MGKRSGLERLTRLYGRIENLHALQVKSAANAVLEVEQAMQALASQGRDQANQGRKALAQGSRVESLAGQHTAEADAQRCALLRNLAVERQQSHAAAVEAHRVSRIESAQLEEMVERNRREAENLATRRAQSASDDRFLSRRHWKRTRQLADVEESLD